MPHLITSPRLVKQQARVSGSGCGRAGGEQWEVSACSCTVICFSCQALLNKQLMYQVGISLVQGGFSLNLSRWECFLVQGSYLMFTLPKGHSQYLCVNFTRHNPCLKHLVVWACSSARRGVEWARWMPPRWQVPVLLGPVISLISLVNLCIYFGSLVSGRERAGVWKHQEWGHGAGEHCQWETENEDQHGRGDWSRNPSARKIKSHYFSSFHHFFSEAVTSTGVENKGDRCLSSVLFWALTGDNFSASSFLEVWGLRSFGKAVKS